MLVLSGKKGERFRLTMNGVDVWVYVCSIKSQAVRIGFDAPRAVRIDRDKLIKRGEVA